MKEDIQKWKVVESECLFSDKPWLTVIKESLELPNGNKIAPYYTLEYPNWINVIAITKEGKFLFVRQYRHGVKTVNYELCAGICDPEDTSPMETAKRELLEETGYGKGNWQEYMTCSANPGTHTNRVYTFLATDIEKISAPQLEDTEDLSVHFFTLDEVKEMLLHEDIIQSVMIAPLWRFIAETK